ncbi:hypothetical protein [Bacteroides ovatus]|uniref:hypothetical protein n=5 Tax=Bacteroides ovatus TaxID=28116 RepID=UPI002030C0B8|nr:hypothetical protein [Bacteroides ovatus]MCM1722608.1 hypothetical protein [Bacteroides ovatus]
MKRVSLIIVILVVGIPLIGLTTFNNLIAQSYSANSFINYYFTPKNLGFSTPQSAELTKYSPTTLDHYNGLMNFELPILHYQDNSFDIPITIKYISDGFKPGRRPSLIGNNWSLNVGGVITRNVFGRPDDEIGINQKMFRDGLLAAIRNGKYRYYSKEELFNLAVAKADSEKTSDIGDLEHDYAPDIFNFSFGGYKGFFFIGNDGKIKSSLGEGFQIDIDKLSIQNHLTADYTPINSTIKITTPDGYIYEFGGTQSYLEYNIPNNPSSSNPSSIQITSWYLNSIKNANNKRHVYFNYKKYIQRNEYKNFIAYYTESYIEPMYQWIPGYPYTEKNEFSDGYTFKDNLDTPIIDEIMIDDVHIKFEIGTFNESFYNEGNYDLLYLKEITESHGTTEKRISFEYLHNGNYFFLHHLKLNSQATNPDFYSFDYNLNTTLPDTRTISVDHWGYWNGTYAIEEESKSYLNNIENRKAVNTAVADATMLTNITFPTGGETKITYEPNYYNHWYKSNTSYKWEKEYSSTPIPCGGVRIKQITDYNPVNKKEITRTYNYVTPDGKGSGVIGILPKYRSEEQTRQTTPGQYINGQWNSFRITGYHTSISSNTIGRLYNISEHHVGYSDVNEIYSDNSRVSYHFSSRIDIPDDENINGKATTPSTDIQIVASDMNLFEKYGLHNSNDMSGYRGKLLSKITYSNKQEMLLMQFYTYNIDEWLKNYEISISSAYQGLAANRIYYTPCRVVKELQADINGVEIHKIYSYNSKNLVSEKRIVQSNKDTLFLSYIYPFENSTVITGANHLSDLISINKISEPVLTLKYIQRNNNNSSQLLSAIKYNYGNFNNQFLKSSLSEWSINTPVDGDYSLEKGQFTIKEQYLNYDNYSNIICLVDKYKDTTVYIWSYKGKYPIAKIKGATYSQVNSALGTSPESLSNNNAPDIDKLNALRSKLPSSSINTYTYSPLIGLTTSTNPRGITTYFEYDSSGRLVTTKDYSLNHIKKSYYKYYNQRFEENPQKDKFCNVTLDTSGPGGDGSIKTVKMRYGETLPIPTPAQGYSFEGWYDGNTKITIVPNSPNRTITGKFAIDKKGITLNLRDGWLQTEDTDSYYYAGKTIELTTNTTDVVSFIINGTQMKDPDAVRYPVTVKNNGIYQAYWEERAYRNGNWVQLSGDACKLSSFSIIVNGTYVTTNEALDSWEHGLPSRLNGSVYTKGNITCTIKLLK